VDGIGRLYLDPTEASLMPSAIQCSLHADIVEAYPSMMACNGVRVHLGIHILQGAVPRTTMCTEGVTRIIDAPPPMGLTVDNIFYDSAIGVKVRIERHPSSTLDAFVISRQFSQSVTLSRWLDVPESEVVSGSESG